MSRSTTWKCPILDGSGLPFVRADREAGIRQYRRKRRYLRIRRPISVEDKGKRISILPAEVFRLTCDTDYPAPVGRQSLEMEVTPERYARRLRLRAHLRLGKRSGPDAQYGTDPRRIAGECGLLHQRSVR